MSGPQPRRAKAEELNELAKLVAVPLATFSQVFQRAQQDRDIIVDVAEVGASGQNEMQRIRACYDYAQDKEFLRRLLTTALEGNIAGAPGSPNALRFAALATALGLKVKYASTADGYAEFEAQAINENGFDTAPMQLYKQVLTAMRSVCRIRDTKNALVGTGVLIAPHLVATAAHVVAKLIDADGKPLAGSREYIDIRMDLVADLPGADQHRIPVADDWLLDCSLWPADMLDADGQLGSLPAEPELKDLDDLAVIKLAEAPGFLRGWLDVESGGPAATSSKGLIFHHHARGGDQKVSIGHFCKPYGPRFEHSCSSLGGSSGGPLINTASRIAGVHHGTIIVGGTETNLGGGGQQLAQWLLDREADYNTPPLLNPVWEIRKTGEIGSGQPVIGFEKLQRKIWDIELAGQPAAQFVQGSAYAGRLVFDIVETMLPADRALVIRFDRVLLNDIILALSSQASEESQTAIAIAEIVKRIGVPVPDLAEQHSTDPVEARAAAPGIADALSRLPADRNIWILVNIGDLDVPTPLSEALTYLYRACLRINRDRGRLLVAGSDERVYQKVASLVRDALEINVDSHVLGTPDADDVERYILRCIQEIKSGLWWTAEVAEGLAKSWLNVASDNARERGTDFYSALENAIKYYRAGG